MKRIYSSIVFFTVMITVALGQAPRPEKVESFTRVMKTHEWYVEQSNLWKAETEKNPGNADAWFNFYRASRYARITADRTGDAPESLPDLEEIVREMEKHVPGTFEYAYTRFIHSSRREEQIEFLKKSYALSPEHVELWLDLILFYEIRRDTVHRAEFCRKYFMTNEMSPAIYAWNYNMLMPLERDAILITMGDNDTYPAWILQDARGIREDVTVINAGTLYYNDYMSLILKELGMPVFRKKASDFTDFTGFMNELLKFVAENAKGRSLYFAVTLPDVYYRSIENHCFNEGLAIRYSREPSDHIAVIRNNFEQIYLLDYIRVPLINDVSQEIVHRLNNSYINAFVLLYDSYLKEGDKIRTAQLMNLMKKIAKDGGSEKVKNQIRALSGG